MVGSTQGSSLRHVPASWLLAGSACEVRQLQLDWHGVSPCCLPCAGHLEGHCLPSAFTCPQDKACLLVYLERWLQSAVQMSAKESTEIGLV